MIRSDRQSPCASGCATSQPRRCRDHQDRSSAPGGGAFTSPEDLASRTGLPLDALEGLAASGAMESIELGRREGIWAAGALAELGPTGWRWLQVLGLRSWPDGQVRAGPGRPVVDFDICYPPGFVYSRRAAASGCITIQEALEMRKHGVRARVGGLVTHRQRPGTANGVRFLNLEDETGLLNVIVLPPVWDAHYEIARKSIGWSSRVSSSFGMG